MFGLFPGAFASGCGSNGVMLSGWHKWLVRVVGASGCAVFCFFDL
jgi:hypothetical protein